MPASDRDAAAISPTAHYTAQAWLRNGLSDPRLHTPQGTLYWYALEPLAIAMRAIGGPTLETFLLARHELIDLRLSQAIDSGRVTQVIEIAAGLSPRGLRFVRRYGDRITYVEADLPGMAARKRELLGQTAAYHRIVAINALVDEGPDSLATLAKSLDATQGVAIVTEGLLNYFAADDVRGMWSRFVRALDGFPHGLYLSDIHVRGNSDHWLTKGFMTALSRFVRGRVHLHWDRPQDVARELLAAGFTVAHVHDPHDFADELAACAPEWASLVRVIEATTGR